MRQTARADFNTHLGVRQTDDLKYVVRHFNDLTASLSKMTRDDIERVENLMAGANEIHNRLGSEPEQQANANLVVQLMKEMQDFKDTLNSRVEQPVKEEARG
jgi:hypothetical protein